MRGAFISIAVIALAVDSPGGEQSEDRLLVDIDAVSVEIGARPSGRRPIYLPNLEFTIRLEPHCAAGLNADSISVSVADTRLSIGHQALAEQSVIETTIQVPRKQIGPLVVEDFCVTGDNAANDAVLHIRDAMTSQLSLKCADDSRQSILYRTEALAIRLVCETPAVDQVPASPATTRF